MARRTLTILLAAWAGIVIGVSFLATPAKFLAPSLSMEVALDVGRYTFRLLANLELAMAVIASLLCWIVRPGVRSVSGLAVICVLVLVERWWLLPVLDERVSLVLAGTIPPASSHHMLFIGMESAKTLMLLACAVTVLGSRPPK